jgi:hypothetical protein
VLKKVGVQQNVHHKPHHYVKSLGTEICMLICGAALNRIKLSSTDQIKDVVDTNIDVTKTAAITVLFRAFLLAAVAAVLS